MLNIFSPFEKTSNIARSEKRVKAQPGAMIRIELVRSTIPSQYEVIKIDNRSPFGVERSTSGFA